MPVEYTEANIAKAESLIAEWNEEQALLVAREDYLYEQRDNTKDSIARLDRMKQPYVVWLADRPGREIGESDVR